VLILSTVRSQKRANSGASIGFVADVRRMNVALTRARNSLWVVGNSAALKRNPHWAELVSDATKRGLVVEARRPYSALFTPGGKGMKKALPGPSVNTDGEGGKTVSKGVKRPADLIPLGRGKKPKVTERSLGLKRKPAEGSLEVPAAKTTRPNGDETSKGPKAKLTDAGKRDARAEEKIAEAADFLKPALAPLKVPGSKGVPNSLPKAPRKGILKNAMSKLEAAGGQIPVVPSPPRGGGLGPAGPSGSRANQTPDWAPFLPRVSPSHAPLQADSPITAAPPDSIFSKPIDVPISLTNMPAPLANPMGQPPVPAVGQDKPGSRKMRDFGLRVEIPVPGGTITGHPLKPVSSSMQSGVETPGQEGTVRPPTAEMPLPHSVPGGRVSETLDLPPGFGRSAEVETDQKQKASLAVLSPFDLEAQGQKEGKGPHPSTDQSLPSGESAMERRIRELQEKPGKADDQKRDVSDRKSDVESGEGGSERVSRVGEEQKERDRERAEKERVAEEKERRNRENAKKYALAEKDRKAARDRENERDRYRGESDRYRDKEKDQYGRGKRERSPERGPRKERDAEVDRKRERRNEPDSQRREYSERGREGARKRDESRGGGREDFKVPANRERGGSSTQRGKESPRGVGRERGRERSEEKTGGRSSIQRGGLGKESPRGSERRERVRSEERDRRGSRTPKEGFLREGWKGTSRKDWRRGESEETDRARSRTPKSTSVAESPKRREREGQGRSEEKDRGGGRTPKESSELGSPRGPGREDRVRNRAEERDRGRSTTPKQGSVPGGLEDQNRFGREKDRGPRSSPKGVKDSLKSPGIEESGKGKSDGKRSDSNGGDRREGLDWRVEGGGQTEGEVFGRSKEGSQQGLREGLNGIQRDRSKGQDGQRGAEERVDRNRNEDGRTGGHTGLQEEEGLELTRKEESRKENLPRSEGWLHSNQEGPSQIRGPGKEVGSALNREEDRGERSRSGREVSEDANENVGGRSRAGMGPDANEHSDPYQKSTWKDEGGQSMREEGQKMLPLEGSQSRGQLRQHSEGGSEANPRGESVSRDDSLSIKQAGLEPDSKGDVSKEVARAPESVRSQSGEEYQRVGFLKEGVDSKQRERSQTSQKLRPVLNAGIESTETLGVGMEKEARQNLGESLEATREEQRSEKVSVLSEHGLTANEKEASRNVDESRRNSGASLSSHQTVRSIEGSVRSGGRNSDAAAGVVLCRYYPNCDKGDACRFAHVLPPCIYFRSGDCWKGKSCSFAHSQEAKPKEGQKETSRGQGPNSANAAKAPVADGKEGGGSGEPSKARAVPERPTGVKGAGKEEDGQNKTPNPVSLVDQGSKAGSEARRPEPTAAEPGASPAVSKNKGGGLASNEAPIIHSTISPKSSGLKKGGGIVAPKVHATDSPGLSERKRQREEAAALMSAGSFRSQSARLAPSSVQSAYAMPRSVSDIGRRKTLPLGEELRRRVGTRGEIPGAEEGAEEGELVERKQEPRGGVNRPQVGGVNVVGVPQPRPGVSVPRVRGTVQGISPGRGRIQDRLSGPPFRGESRREDSVPGGFGPGPWRSPVSERLAFPPGGARFLGGEEFRPDEERFRVMEEEREYLVREAMLREDARRGETMNDALAREGMMGRGRDVGLRVADERDLRMNDAREVILRGERGAIIGNGMLRGGPNEVLQDERDLQGPFPNEPTDLREVLICRNSQGFVGNGPIGEGMANHRVPIHERLSRRPHPENGMQRPW
jgi:hypothetical protein